MLVTTEHTISRRQAVTDLRAMVGHDFHNGEAWEMDLGSMRMDEWVVSNKIVGLSFRKRHEGTDWVQLDFKSTCPGEIPEHYHTQWTELMVQTEGGLTCTTGGKEYPQEPSSVFVVKPFIRHAVRWESSARGVLFLFRNKRQ